MTTPYSYHLYHAQTGKHYYGIRYAKKCHPNELWKTYFSSSKIVKQMIKQYGLDSFTFEIRKTFSTGEETLLWEQRVLTRLDAARNPNWINRHNGGRKFRSPLHHSEETKLLLSSKLKGRIMSEDHKRKIAEKSTWKSKLSPEVIQKRNAKLKGRKRDPEMVQRMRATKTGTKRHYLPDGSYVYLKS